MHLLRSKQKVSTSTKLIIFIFDREGLPALPFFCENL